jgi:predicted nucleic acid-binding protein
MDDQEILIFDTSPLIHFSREGWLGPLKAVVGARSAVIPDVVAAELQAAAVKDGRVAAALDQEWLVTRPLQSAERSLPPAIWARRIRKMGGRERPAGLTHAPARTGDR